MPILTDYIPKDTPADSWLNALVTAARDEDLGPQGVDITSMLLSDRTQGQAHITAREQGVLAGGALLARICQIYGGQVRPEIHLEDGVALSPGSIAATLHGPLPEILKVERVALNFMGHLSGIASLTAQFVAQTAGTCARIMDTRKTLPGFRHLAKYAVACGGGGTHRMGLFDAVLIKDNHIAHLDNDALADFVQRTAEQARTRFPDLQFVMIEVDTLDQLQHALTAEGVDLVLLDNMPPNTLQQAVTLRDTHASHILLEASGGVNLSTVRGIAESGVDRISVGALTHSARNLDLGLDIS